tara:strand:+ start:6158 stop:7153 length:996 start_codon:yes stop_codon:yes gene_type:complete
MKTFQINFKIFIKLLIIFIFSSCSSIIKTNSANSKKLNKIQKQVELPFNEKDYPSNDKYFYQITNSRNKSLNIAKQKNLLNAKTLLAQKIYTNINSISNQRLKFINNEEIEIFNSKVSSISKILVEKIKTVDSKLFKSADGQYEYWAIYTIKLKDVIDLSIDQELIEKEDSNDFYKINIDDSFNLEPTEFIEPNFYLINNTTSFRERVIVESKSFIGVPYVWGGNNPDEGFDCSGYVRWVIKKSMNILIPRTTLDQSVTYKDKLNYNINNCKEGDLIYFKTRPNRKISHVGIFLGGNKFIHAPNEKETVKIDELSGYWKENYVGHVSLESI